MRPLPLQHGGLPAQRAAKIDALKPTLETTYRAIATQAPHARILVLGYAQPFPARRAEQSCAGLRLFAGEQDMLRALGVRLNATIASAVAAVAEERRQHLLRPRRGAGSPATRCAGGREPG